MNKRLLFIVFCLLLSACLPVSSTQDQIQQEETFPENTTVSTPTAEAPDPVETIINEEGFTNSLFTDSANIGLIAKLPAHTENTKVWSLAADRNNRFVSGGEDGKVIVWDAEQLEIIRIEESHSKIVTEVYILQNGEIITLSNDQTLRKLNPENGNSEILINENISRFTINQQEDLAALSFSNDSISIRSFPDFEEISSIQLTDGCFEMRFDSESKHLFTVGHNGKVQKWDIESGDLIQEYIGLSMDVHCLELTPDGVYLAAGATDNTVMVWDVQSGNIVSFYRHFDGLYDLDISSDGKLIVSVGVDRQVFLANLQTGEVLKMLPHNDEILTVAIDPHCQYIVAGGYDSDVYIWGNKNLDYTNLEEITLENIAFVEELRTYNAHTAVVFDIAVSSDDSMIASAGRDLMAYIWDTDSGEILLERDMGLNLIQLEFAVDDKYLVGEGEMSHFIIWDLENDRIIYESDPEDYSISSFGLSSNDQQIITGGTNGEIILWRFPQMEKIKEIKVEDIPLMNIKFTPDDQYIFYTFAGDTEDFSVFAIDPETLEPVFQFAGHEGYNYSTAFSADWQIAATAGADNLIKFWNVQDGTLIRTLDDHRGKVMDVDFSKDQSILVSGSAHDYTIRMWDVATGQNLRIFRPGDEIQCVDFGNSGKFFISSGEDGIVRLWGIPQIAD